MFKKIGKNYKRLIFCLALFMVGILLFSRFSQAASGLQVGQSSLILTAAESLIFGNISASSATTSKLLLLQNAGVPKLTVDYYGNLTTPATITAGALSGPMSGTLNAANVSSGLPFGANTGGGNYSFPGNLGIDGTLTGSSLLRQTFGNIKKNAGGEGGAAYWNGSAFSVSSTYARSGANSLRMSGGTSHCNEYIYEDFDTKANTYYSLSGWIKTISETANSAIFISEGVGTGCSEWGRMINSGITGTTDWTQKYIEGWSSGSCTKVRVGFTKQYCDSSGDTYFDDLMVTEGYSPKAFFTRPILDSSSAAQSILGGNLGLGTLTPAARLHVSTAHTGDGALGQRWSYNGGDTMYYLDLKQTVTPGVVRWNFSSVNNGTAYNNTLVLDRGNVGVGTTDPYKTLHVYGAGAALRVGPYYSTDDRDYIDLTAHGSDTRISSRNERFHLENTGGPLVLQGSSGNVGIGVTAPAAKLEVGGNTVIDASSVSWSEGLSIDSSNGVWGGIKWRTIGRSGNTGNWHLGYNATHSLTTDSNLYMYNAAGLYPMTWDYDTGNVGIKTTAPSADLHVSGSLRTTSAMVSGLGSSGSVIVMADNSGNLFSTSTSAIIPNPIPGGTSGQTLRRSTTAWVADSNLYNNGTNVGIGTTGPASSLVVQKNTAGGRGGELSIVNAASGQAGNSAAINFGLEPSTYDADNGNAQIKAILTGSTATDLVFSTWNGSAWGERMRIQSDGNVGIGTTNPLAKVQINNQGAFNATTPGPSSYYGLYFNGQTTTDYATGITWNGGTTGTQAGLYVQGSGAYGTKMYFATTNSYATGAQTRMMIDHMGNVGVNIISPSTKLHVNGSFRANSALISGLGATGNVLVMADNSGNLYTSPAASSLLWSGSTSGNIWNANSGNVGIGTNAPKTKLAVFGAGRFGTGDSIYMEIYGNGTSARVGQSSDSSIPVSLYGAGNVQVNIDSNNNEDFRYFSVNNNAIQNGSELFRVQENGNVGIGSAAPSQKLDVAGAMKLNTSQVFGYSVPTDLVSSNMPYLLLYRVNDVNPVSITGTLYGSRSDRRSGAGKIEFTFGTDGYGTNRTSGSILSVSGFSDYDAGLYTVTYNGESWYAIKIGGSNYLNAWQYNIRLDSRITYGGATTLSDIKLVSNNVSNIIKWNSAGGILIDPTLIVSGNVGIGSTNPGTKLDVSTSFRSNSATITGLGATGNVVVMADNTGLLYTSPAASSLLWSGTTGGNIWNANSGNVGIGISSPTGKLQIAGNGAYPTATTSNSQLIITANNNRIEFGTPDIDNARYAWILARHDIVNTYGGYYSTLHLQPDISGVENDYEGVAIGYDPSLKLNSTVGLAVAGNVGIGTTNPGNSRLSVVPVTGSNGVYITNAGGNANSLLVDNNNADYKGVLINHTSLRGGGNCGGDGCYGFKFDDKRFNNLLSGYGPSFIITRTGSTTISNLFQVDSHGVNGLAVSDSGNVGIGSTNPGTKLDVSTSFRSNSATITGLGATGNVVVMADNTGLLYTSPAASSLLWSGTTSGNIWNANSGNVGVGTSTPASKLTVVSGNPAAPYSGIGLFSGSASSYTSYTVGRTAVDGYFGVAGSSNHYLNGTAAGDVIIDSVSGKVVIGTGAIVGTLGLVVNNGSVGIGTNAPGSKLDVQTAGYGWPATSGSVQTYGGLRISPPSASGSVVLDTGVNTSSGGWLQVTNRGNLSIEYPLILNPNGGNVGVGATSPGTKLYVDTSFRTNTATVAGLGAAGNVTVMADNSGNLSTAKMWLLNGTNVYYSNTGSVGIGTATPGAKLHVYSSAASGFLDNLATAVFDKDDSRLQIRSTDAGTYGSGLILTTASSSWAMMAQTSSDANKFYIGYRLSTASEDIPSASSKFLTIKTDGNVGVGVTSPGARLEVSSSLKTNSATITGLGTSGNVVVMADNSGGLYATSTAAFFNSYVTGDINLGNHNITNVNKLTVNTIDPLYSIGGKKYSTYASSLAGGVKEEYVGRMYIGREIKENGRLVYENTLDFAKIEAGSDLWVWRKVVDFNRDNVEVLITPYGSFASTYYLVGDNKIIFRSSAPVEVSYRLIGKRFDWRLWPTFQPNASERGLLVE